MYNLSIGDTNELIQLLFGASFTTQIHSGQRLMQVIEYTDGERTLARKFDTYI